MLLVVHKTSAD